VHTDERGADDWNMRLSGLRAQAVVQALIDRGVAPQRLVAHGYGESKPLCTEHVEACWAKNRRVELKIVRRAGS
jgi:outer membrane protein OmpA-like peptidoglycan-associated protein